MNHVRFPLLVAALAAIESGLILFGILPPTTSNSLGNILIALAREGVILYMGLTFSADGLKKVALWGMAAAGAGFLTFCLAMPIGASMQRPVFGIASPSLPYLMLILLISGIINLLMGGLIALSGAWIAQKIMKSQG